MSDDFRSKFKIDELLIYSSKYWSWSVRPKQVTIGSGILSLNRACTSLGDITEEESKDYKNIIKVIEATTKKTFNYDKINYLMLMMEDSQVHYHILPRYSTSIIFSEKEWNDENWPVAPQLVTVDVDDGIIHDIKNVLVDNLSSNKRLKVGYTTGVYDMFHVGHLNLLKQAKEKCDYLVVGVTSDELVSYKNTKAVISHRDRMEIVANCKFVDKVVPQNTMDKMAAWESIKFDAMFVGDDWKGTDTWNKFEEEFSKVGVEIVYFPYTKGISSTKLRKLTNHSQ